MVHFSRFFRLSRRWLKFSFLTISILMLCLIATPLVAQSVSPQDLVRQGKQFYETGQFEQALSQWEQATTAYQKQQDPLGVSGSLINQAQALSALGLQRRACKTLVQALKLNDADNDRLCDPVFYDKQVFQPDLSDPLLANVQATGLRSLGNVLRLIGNLEASQAVLEQSLKIAPQDAKADILVSLGNTLRDLGNRDRDRTDKIGEIQAPAATHCLATQTGSETAIVDYKQAIDCYREAANTASNPFTALQSQSNHLALLVNLDQWLYQNNPVEAIQWNAQTRSQTTSLITNLSPLIERLPATYEGIFTRINFARSLGMQSKQNKLAGNNPVWQVASSMPISTPPAEDWNRAKQLLEQAWQQAQALKNIRASSAAAGNLGWLYEQSEQWDEALIWTETALNLVGQVQAPEMEYQWEWQIGRILKQQGKVKDAIAAYNQAVTALQATRGDLVAVNPDAQFSLRDTAEPIYRELIDLVLQPANPDQAALKKAVELIDSLRLAELEDFLRCRLAELKTVQVDQVNDPTAAIFYPIVLRDRIELILKLPQQNSASFKQKQLGLKTNQAQPKRSSLQTLRRYPSVSVGQKKLEEMVNQLQSQLKMQFNTDDKNFTIDTHKKIASQLYEWLIRPIENDLESSSIKTLVFVLDGVLRSIPLGVLYDAQQQNYLLDQYAIAVTPGLDILGAKVSNFTYRKALIAGLTTPPPERLIIRGEKFNFSLLENVSAEVKAIRSLLPQSDLLEADQFTPANFRAKLNSTFYPIVHLATHGIFRSDPQKTFLLADGGQPIILDELQRVLQGQQTRPEAIELIVLSACETAVGDRRATLGLAGATIRAGANSTLASLWSVNDQSTALIMERFYQELTKKQPMTKAEALRNAQRGIRQEHKEYDIPYYWAPFVLVGNWL